MKINYTKDLLKIEKRTQKHIAKCETRTSINELINYKLLKNQPFDQYGYLETQLMRMIG